MSLIQRISTALFICFVYITSALRYEHTCRNHVKRKMHIHTLLSILTLPLTVKCQSWWNIITDLIPIPFVPEDARFNINQLAFKYKYNLEDHKVITEDGYIIKFHRIPNGRYGNKNGKVVFLMHGIIESSDSWLLQGPNDSLAFFLADEGFDVWMGNARGNKHAIEHATLNSTSSKYWDFTWEEIGLYDLPAMIDYILNVTKRNNLYYIGHSQGTTSCYVLLSMKPEYNAKIKLMFSLAPEAWMENVKSPLLKMFSSATNEIGPLLDYSVFSSGNDYFNKISSFMCNLFPCDNVMFTLMGHDSKIKEALWPVIFGHMPTGSSTLQFIHYGQLVNTNRFCRFDYGVEKNVEVYGQPTPPDYDLSNIEAPIVLYYSYKDWLSDPKDVDTLKSKLPNVLDTICLSDFGHMDYVYASEAREEIYLRIVAQIDKLQKSHALRFLYV